MFQNLAIAKRLGIAISFLLVLMFAVAASGYWGLKSMSGGTVSMLRGDAKLAEHLHALAPTRQTFAATKRTTSSTSATLANRRDTFNSGPQRESTCRPACMTREQSGCNREEKQTIKTMQSDLLCMSGLFKGTGS